MFTVHVIISGLINALVEKLGACQCTAGITPGSQQHNIKIFSEADNYICTKFLTSLCKINETTCTANLGKCYFAQSWPGISGFAGENGDEMMQMYEMTIRSL